jgi:hypothetical protein
VGGRSERRKLLKSDERANGRKKYEKEKRKKELKREEGKKK